MKENNKVTVFSYENPIYFHSNPIRQFARYVLQYFGNNIILLVCVYVCVFVYSCVNVLHCLFREFLVPTPQEQ